MDSNSDNSNFIDKLAFKIDEHLQEIRIGLCTIALVALGYAVKSIKPFTKFSHIQQIPSSFIEKNIKLNGKVVDIISTQPPDTSSPQSTKISILVDHRPIFKAPFSKRSHPLSISLDSVAVTEQGLTTLSEIMLNRHVDFVLLAVDNESKMVSCIVYCQLPQFSVWRRLLSSPSNIAFHLVETGLASVTPSDSKLAVSNTLYRQYYQRLLQYEEEAERNGRGMWRKEEEEEDSKTNAGVSVWTRLGQWCRSRWKTS
uniref:Protein C3orf33 n=1 Tax=Cacopsylla melanoneura TaxID=428564 RepID=A0A8D8VTA1_9HEMI